MGADLSSRVWFLPNGCNEKNLDDVDSWSCLLEKGNFFDWSLFKEGKFTWEEAKKFPHIFLVWAPITFGHSQLVIPRPGKLGTKERKSEEVIFFEEASKLISKDIYTFQKVFKDKKIHQNDKYKMLAKDTYTYGDYVKTLIVRASAKEQGEYKVHLIPYFQSHANGCLERFRKLYRVAPNRPGGLIGWLGEREKEVDKWEIEGVPGPHSLDEIAECVWKLPQLAEELRSNWDCH